MVKPERSSGCFTRFRIGHNWMVHSFMFVCLMVLALLSTIFQLYRGIQFYWWRTPEDPEKPTASHWQTLNVCLFVCLMVLSATFNNISVISWHSALLVEETGRPGENHRHVASHWQTWSHNVVRLALIEIRTPNIGGDRHWLHR
jgi:hypothetical protein